MTALSRPKSSTSGWPSRSMSRVIKPRFQHQGLSLEHRSSPVRSNSLESVRTYGQICIHSVSRSGKMVTGKTPFQGAPGEVMHQHLHAPLPLEELERVAQPLVVLPETLLEK